MEVLIVGVVLVGLIVIGWTIATTNRMARLELLLRESWANVDVALKRRHDLVPNLVATVKGYAAHEIAVLERVVAARNAAVNGGAREESELVRAVNGLLIRAEAYPELRSNENFLSLQSELVNTEDRIAAARRFFNANVRDYNTLIESFPASLLASGRKPREFYEVEDIEVRSPVQVNLATK